MVEGGDVVAGSAGVLGGQIIVDEIRGCGAVADETGNKYKRGLLQYPAANAVPDWLS